MSYHRDQERSLLQLHMKTSYYTKLVKDKRTIRSWSKKQFHIETKADVTPLVRARPQNERKMIQWNSQRQKPIATYHPRRAQEIKKVPNVVVTLENHRLAALQANTDLLPNDSLRTVN
jgi:hypothetical protein